MLLTMFVGLWAPAEGARPGEVRGAGDEAAVLAVEVHPGAPEAASAPIEGRSGSHMRGTVTIAPEPALGRTALAVAIHLDAATPGNHAVFLHEAGDCTAGDASSAGGWLGPPPVRSPSPGTGPVGDEARGPPPGYLGFVTVGADGRGEKDLVLRAYTLAEGPGSLLDRAIVVYERAPDFTRGDVPGARQGCGVIRAR